MNQLRDHSFGHKSHRAIAPAVYTDETVLGPWLDTWLRDEIIENVTDISAVEAAGSATITYEMTNPTSATDATPDAGAVIDVPAALVVLPKHTDLLPNQPPTIGSNPAAVTAANDADKPLRVYIDPQYSSGSTGLLRFVRQKIVVVNDVSIAAQFALCVKHAGLHV